LVAGAGEAMPKDVPQICLVRLQKELRALAKESPDFVTARPMDENLLVWHFLLFGPAESPYAGGCYHGALTFPKDYPFSPPSIRMITPNGRFKPNAKICMNFSDFHPETWNPMWSVSTVLHGLLAFMLDSSPAVGVIQTSAAQKRELAAASWASCAADDGIRDLFPEAFTPQAEQALRARVVASAEAAQDEDEDEQHADRGGKAVGAAAGGPAPAPARRRRQGGGGAWCCAAKMDGD